MTFMKRKALALTLILALSVSTVALQFFSVTSANFIGALILPNEPNTTPLTIVVHSPVQNETCNSTEVWLNFTIIKPKGFFGNVTSVWYTVDGGESQNIEVHDRFVNDSDSIFLPIKELNFSSNLKLTAGAHNVKVSLEAQSFYIDYVDRQGWIFPSVLVHAESETVNLTQALVIEVTSPENKTYDTSSIPLNFTVNTAVSQITYSLDGEENITFSGNTTLAGLANGDYNITVYVRDGAGNAGSETTYFSVDVPFPTTMVIAPIASVAIIGAGLLVYFKKHNH
jgi:hypothetical protein